MTEDDKTHPLIEHLYDLARRDDRAALAALRAGLRPGREWEALRIVLPHVRAKEPWIRRAEDDALLLGGLFALHPERGTLSVPRAMALVKEDTQSESIEHRFTAMLAASREDLPQHLRHAITLIASRDRPLRIDWDLLRSDLRFWSSERTRRRWAREFWTPAPADAKAADPASTSTLAPNT